MKEILRYAKSNVRVRDQEGKILFEDHNLFVDSGRALIADIFRGAVMFDVAKIACDLGSGSSNPSHDQLDLDTYTAPLSTSSSATYPQTLSGQATGVHFQFIFNNTTGSDQTIKELGLFYRPVSDDFPRRGSDPPTMTGSMIARLKTTLSSITVGDTRMITIDWKIIF